MDLSDPQKKFHARSPQAYYFLPCLIIPLLVILIYGNTFKGGFHFDDQRLIEINPAIRDLSHPVRVILSNDPGHKNRPLLMLSLGFSYHFSGHNSFGYHLFNILLHSFSSILIYAICLLLYHFSIGAESFPQKACRALPPVGLILLAVLFFCVQPMNSEAITYISGRSSSMCTFFVLFSFYAFFKYRLHDVQRQPFRNGMRLGMAALFFCLSLASKEVGIVLPVLLLGADFYFFFLPQRKGGNRFIAFLAYLKERWASFLPFFLVIILFFAIRYQLQDGAFLEKNSGFLKLYTRASYFYTQLNIITYYYINKLFFPLNQNIDIYFDIFKSFLNFSTLFAGAALLVLVILAVLARTTLWLSFAVFWFIVALAPTSSFAPILDVAVERRLYLSGIAMVFFWFFLLSSIPRRKITIFLLPLLFFSINTIQRNTVYKDGVTLWRDSSSKSLREPRPHFNCAKALKKYGYPDEAIIEYQKAMAIGYSPYNHEIHNGLGVIYMEKGLYRKAIEEFQEAIRVKYDFDFPHNNLASAYLKLGETEKAAEALSKAISINPDNIAARNNLGVIYAQKGLYEKAYNEFKAILDKNPMEIEIKKNLEKLEAIMASERGDK